MLESGTAPAERRALFELPFHGFYESAWSQGIDREEEQFAEYEAEEREDGERAQPEALRLTAGEICDALFRATDYSTCYQQVARGFVDAFDSEVWEALDWRPELTFESMTSPRFYNFETDRVFATAPWATAERLFAMSAAENHETLARIISGRFTSRDGFASFYDNDLESWLEKPLDEWDHNELGTLLRACLAIAKAGPEGDGDLHWPCFERLADCDGFYHEWSAGVDWPAYEARIADMREEKREAAQEAGEEIGEVPPVRCPDTLDLFRAGEGA